MALFLGSLHQVRYHDNGGDPLLPDQSPEINHSSRQRTYSQSERERGKKRAIESLCTVYTTGHTHAQVHKRNAGIENIFHTLSGKELVWLRVTLYET